MMMMMEGITTSMLGNVWKFRDGKEYLVSLEVNETLPKSLSITLSDKITAAEWKGQFDPKYIESLTQRTGNYKSFDTFVAMIKCGVLKKTEAVTLDLMSYDDLLALRDRKRRLGETTSSSIQNLDLGSNCPSESVNNIEVGREVDKIPKKYLIMTYVAEFDKVHYPLKLNYMGFPDLSVMQETILKLKNELNHLRNTNKKLTEKLKNSLENRQNSTTTTTSHNEDGETEENYFVKTYDNNNEIEDEGDDGLIVSSCSGTTQCCKKSKTIITNDDESSQNINLRKLKRLEEQIQSERKAHVYQMTSMKGENDYLRVKMKSIEVSEAQLQQKVDRLESALALNLEIEKNDRSSHHHHSSSNLVQPEQTLLQNNNTSQNYPIRGQPLSRPPGRRGFDVKEPRRRGFDDKIIIDGDSRPVSSNNSVTSFCSRCSLTSGGGGGGSENSSCWTKIQRPSTTSNNNNNNNEFRPGNVLSRSKSCEKRTAAFNPTEYVTQKKMKQEIMDRMRIASIESRIQRETRQKQGNNNNNNNFGQDKKISTATTNLDPSNLNFNSGHRKRSVSEQGLRRRPAGDPSRDDLTHHRSSVGPITTRRKTSPSPVRRTIPPVVAGKKERLSRKSTKIIMTNTTDRSTNDNDATIDLILNHVRKHCNEKEGSKFQKRQTRKKKLQEPGRPVPTTVIESNHSLDKLKRRLHTLHTFLDKTTTKSRGTKQ